MNKKHKKLVGQFALNLFFICVSLCYILPLVLMIANSVSGSINQGFSLIPKDFTLNAYKQIFAKPQRLIDAYGVSLFDAGVGTIMSLVVMALFAYPLSRPNFKLKGILTFIVFFTTLFNGGLVANYVIYSKYLHLNDTVWIYILPGMVSAWNVIVIRTYFQGLPKELFECARLDGASELRICFRIAVPLSTPVLASVGFLKFISAWNSWSTSQVYIRNPKLIQLQYLLKQILDDLEKLERMLELGSADVTAMADVRNLETLRFAMAIVAAGPMLVIFPFFQKYFAKGMTLGSVKG